MIFNRCCAICADSVVVLLKWHLMKGAMKRRRVDLSREERWVLIWVWIFNLWCTCFAEDTIGAAVAKVVWPESKWSTAIMTHPC
jgi:hypothetical protein